MKLYYLPVERYDSRWTGYASGEGGMFHVGVQEARPDVSLEIIAPHNQLLSIRSGAVVDTAVRTEWSFWQIQQLIQKIQQGEITSESVIYFEDFWTPGFEMIPYTCHLAGIRPRVYAFCHAQSVDEHDFTYAMRSWMRHMEVGWATWLTGIFVAAEELKTLLARSVCSPDKVHVTGTVMRRDNLIHAWYEGEPTFSVEQRKTRVVFTSRLAAEKRPDLFLDIAAACTDFPWWFVILSGRKIPQHFQQVIDARNLSNVLFIDKLTKRDYFYNLATASVMLNCADQDFVSYGLLDAMAYGCLPLLPDYLTFPDAVGHDTRHLYLKENVQDARRKLICLMELAEGKMVYRQHDGVPEVYQKYGTKYERSVARMLDIMLREPTLTEWIEREKHARA